MKQARRSRNGTLFIWVVAFLGLFLLGPISTPAQEGVSDQEITDAVENELRYDPAVNPATMDIVTLEGVVTLRGTTTNLLARERAERIAETVKGVRSVINLIQVRPPLPRSDDALEDDVEAALKADPVTESYEVTASVENGAVTLRGIVDSWTEKQLAGNVARGVRGVSELNNEIEVDLTLLRDDEEVEEEVQEVLRWDVLIDSGLIDVAAEEGHVTLAGVVGSSAEKRRAVTKAHIAGVASVDASELVVARWARDQDLKGETPFSITDQEITEAVERALLYDPRVAATDLTITTEDAIVTLRGQVETLEGWRAAEGVTRNTSGVRMVENRLKVRPRDTLTDPEIQERVEDALNRNPYLDANEILVMVVGGIVKLSGSVDSSFQRATADRLASGISGVVDVENLLEVAAMERPLVYDPYLDQMDPRSLTWYRFQPFSPSTTDAAIQAAIEVEFFWSPFVDGSDINVEVEDGVATLTGTVDSAREREDATENAYEGGAVWVDNELVVRR